MNTFERTAICHRCGTVELKVVPSFSKVDYICSNCGEHIGTVSYSEYESLNPRCEESNCDSSTFKVKISKGEKANYWSPLCSKCNSPASRFYIDKQGNRINRETRDEYIIKDTIIKLTKEVDSLESNLSDVDYSVGYIEGTENDDIVYSVKNQISNCSDNVSSINDLLGKLAEKFNVTVE